MLVEDPLNRSTLSLQTVVELSYPVLQDHPLKASFRLQLSCTVDYVLFKVSGRDCGVLAIVAECTAELVNLICGEACLQPLEPLGQFFFAKPSWLGLGLLISPLREQAFVREPFLQSDGMDLDAGLEEPILVPLDQYSLLQLLVVEACISRRLSPLKLLHLLVVARCLLRALLTYALEELDQLLVRKLQAQGWVLAATQEVLCLNVAVIGWVEGLVSLLDRSPALLELSPELG